MAQANIGGSIPFPYIGSWNNSPPSLSNSFLLDAADEKAAFIFAPPKSGNISHIVFRTGTHTTGADLDVRLEDVSLTDGFPTGSLFAANTNGTQTTAAANTVYRVALTASATVTPADRIAVVIVNPAGSPGNMAIASIALSLPQGFPYCALYTTSWAMSLANFIIGVEYDDGSYAPITGTLPLTALNTLTFNSGTNPNHRGLRFQLGVPATCSGFWALADLDGDCDFLLVADNWDGTDVDALAKVSRDKDLRSNTAARPFWLPWTSSVALSASTTYRLIAKPSSVTNMSLFSYTVGDVARWGQTDAGTEFYYTTANSPNDATDWTDTTTERPFMGLLLTGFADDAGGAGGGLLTNPGMGGGMRG